MGKLFHMVLGLTCFGTFFDGSAGAANEPDMPVTVIISHAAGNYEEKCPGTASKHEDGHRWSVSVEAYRCAKNGHTAFHTYDTPHATKCEPMPGRLVNGFLFTGSGYRPIPWVYRVFLYRDRCSCSTGQIEGHRHSCQNIFAPGARPVLRRPNVTGAVNCRRRSMDCRPRPVPRRESTRIDAPVAPSEGGVAWTTSDARFNAARGHGNCRALPTLRSRVVFPLAARRRRRSGGHRQALTDLAVAPGARRHARH